MNQKFDELKAAGELPSPCGVGMAILDLTGSDDFGTEDLVETIQADPALAGRLIQMANAARAAGVAPVATIDQAAMRLGSNAVRHVALGFSLMSGNRTGRCSQFDYDAYWVRSVFSAVAAQALAVATPGVAGSEAFVCGLLSNVGSLALASAHPVTYGALIADCSGDSAATILAAERAAFEITRHEVSEAILRDWGLPDAVSQAVASHAEPRAEGIPVSDLGSVVWAACVLARFCAGSDEERDGALPEYEQVKAGLGLSDRAFFGLLESLAVEFEALARLLGIPMPPLVRPEERYLQAHRVAQEGAPVRSIGSSVPESDPEVEPCDDGSIPTARVLAIEDDRVSLRILVKELEQLGHEVRTATDGRAGMKIALEWCPQIVITDWVMPKMDGIELCRALRRFETGREMYLIILTGNEEEEQMVHAFEAGVDDYVVKPFRPRLLAARVRAGMRVVRLQEQVASDRATMREQVAELGVMTRRLKQATVTDGLTGLPNRRFALSHLQEAWDEALRDGEPLAVIMADIDHFKTVNDQHGHDAGDHVLKEVGRVMSGALRGNERVCRMGGEEFLVIARGSDLAQASACAERLRAALATHAIRWNDFRRAVTISLGVAEFRPEMMTPFDLVKAADLGAYRAKADGRNRVRSVQSLPSGVA